MRPGLCALALCAAAAFAGIGCSQKTAAERKLDEFKDGATQAASELRQNASELMEDAGKAAENLLETIKK
jgi:hypothetical protein